MEIHAQGHYLFWREINCKSPRFRVDSAIYWYREEGCYNNPDDLFFHLMATDTHVTDSYWTTYCTENHSFSRIHWFFIKIIYKNEIFCKHLLCAKHCAKHLVWSAFGSYCLFFCQESLSGNSLILVKSEHMTESETTKVLPWDFSARPWKEGKFFLLWGTILWHIQRLKK